MLIYIFCFFLLLVGSFFSIEKKRLYLIMLISVLAVVFCCGYMTGSDWRSYETYYSWMSEQNLFEAINSFSFEPGYILYSYLFNFLGIQFWPFFIFTKLLVFILTVSVIYRYSISSYLFEIAFFLGVFGLFLFIDNPMRNLIAITITFYSYKYLLKRDFKKFFFVILLATCFHISAILLLIAYPFYPVTISSRKLLGIFILFYVFSPISYNLLVFKVVGAFSFIPLVEQKIIDYFIDGDSISNAPLFTFGNIIQFSLGILVIWKRRWLENRSNGKILFWGTIIYLFLYRIASSVDIFYRLQLYFMIFYTIGVCAMVKALVQYNNKIVYTMTLGVYLCFMVYNTVTTSYKYIPYSNYLPFLFQEELPYSYRSEYNHRYSPYGK